MVLEKGVDEGRILFLTLIAAPEGIHRICRAFPRVKVRAPDRALHMEWNGLHRSATHERCRVGTWLGLLNLRRPTTNL